MDAQKVVIVEDGKLAIPDAFRKALGFRVGDTVVLEMDAGVLRVHSRQSAIADAQTFVRDLVPDGASLADELVADRLEEVERTATSGK